MFTAHAFLKNILNGQKDFNRVEKCLKLMLPDGVRHRIS